MDEEELFKFNESTTASAKRWQKRALAAESKVVEQSSEHLRLAEKDQARLEAHVKATDDVLARVEVLESTVSERDESIDKLIERASGYGRKVIDLETERNRLSGRVEVLEAKCKRLEGQPRGAWEKRQLVSGCKTMVVDVWFPKSTAPRFDGECVLLPDQSGKVGSDEIS